MGRCEVSEACVMRREVCGVKYLETKVVLIYPE